MEPSGCNRRQPVANVNAPENGSDSRKPLPWAATRLPEAFHGKEGVDGSSPSEGFNKVPANWRFVVVYPLNTRTHSGHIRGTRDARRRLATPPDACVQGRREHIEPRRPCNRA